jgi:DNA topoisomerase-2
MPLWSLTLERLERLKAAIAAKKAEYDELDLLSEKDLWCRDLDAFVEEWENQLSLDREIQTNIRRMGRRVSKKIGAGPGKGGRRIKDEEDYEPGAKKSKAAPKTKVVEQKTHQRFAEMFAAKPKPKPKAAVTAPPDDDDDDFSDDFASLGKPKKTAAPPAPQSEVANGRSKRAAASVAASKAKTYLLSDDDNLSDDDFAALGKPSGPQPSASKAPESASQSAAEDITMADAPPKRAAASKAKTFVIESDTDDDNMLGDVGALVKGIDAPVTNGNGGRLSLFAMSQSGPPAGSTALPKVRPKPSRTFDLDSQDDTNYEALAMSSPRKSTKGDELNDFLSDDDELPIPPKTAAASKASSSHTAAAKPKAPLAVVPAPAKKPRGRPAASKTKPKDDSEEPVAKPKAKPKAVAKPKPAPVAKALDLSPAAKAYAKKRKNVVMSDDDEDMDDDDDDDLVVDTAPPPPARARPGRAAAAKRKPIILDDDSDDDKSDDAFAMDDDSE